MQLKLDQHSPIYQQIVDEFKRAIARGELKPGDRIPSQRELATMVQVNPNTVQRAYREMEQARITETLRGQGTFITNDPGLVAGIRREMAGQALVAFVREMHSLGFECDEMTEMVRSTYRHVIGTERGQEAAAESESNELGSEASGPSSASEERQQAHPNGEGGEPDGHSLV